MPRVSTSQIFSNAQAHVSAAREKEAATAAKATSQKEFSKPSEAPAEWTVSANLKDDLSVRETIAKNAQFANGFLTASENTLAQIQELVGRTHELAIQASGSSAVFPEQFHHVLPEVEGLFNNVVQALNTQFANRPVFGGFQSHENPFDLQGNFLGDDQKIEIEIDRKLKVPVNLSGSEIILGKGLANGVDLMETYQSLLRGLREQDVDSVRNSLDGFANVIEQLSLGRTQIAGSMTEIQRALDSHQIIQEQSQKVISEYEETDLIKVFSDLARDQTVLRAAIETNRKVLNETPFDTLLK
jgi:flagellar hook-associated protein 3 FlgL